MMCGICKKEEMIEARESYHYLECGLPNVFLDIVVRKCRQCGNVMPLIPSLSKLHDAIARGIVKKPGRLDPAEIVFLRKYLGWSG